MQEDGNKQSEALQTEACGIALNEVASLMVTLDHYDYEGLAKVQEALLALPPGTPPLVREKVTRMAAKLGIFLADGGDGEQVMDEVGELLESAMLDFEEVQAREAAEKAGETAAGETEQEPEITIEMDSGPEPEPEEAAPPAPPVAETADTEGERAASPAEPVAAGDYPTEFHIPEDSDEELLGEYITESRECIEDSEGALLELEEDPEDTEAVNRVFRAFHTIKGTSAFLGLDVIAELAHKAETILSRVRDGEIQFGQRYASLSLRSVDMLKALFDELEEGLNSGEPMPVPEEYGELLDELKNPEVEVATASPPPAAQTPTPAPPEAKPEVSAPPADAPTPVAKAPEPVVSKPAPAKKPAATPAAPNGGAKAKKRKGVDSTVRVRTDRLDRLIDMVGELVIAHSIVAQDETVSDGNQHMLSKKVSHTGKIVRELQDLSMSMRMVPLKGTFQKMARLVRDLAVKSGKEVHFTGEGDDTEIDRNMVDLINDPLVHMIRNAVDHGIEPSDDRVSAGKNGVGQVKLMAYHAGGNVIVELSDDGRGLSREKLAEKGVSKGLIESDKGMSDQEVFNLIFEAGFSTAAQVTDISGRGVGMDVVRRNIEALRGRVDISSQFGSGSTFSIRLPLTMAITDGMLIRVGTERFIVPTLNIKMSLRPEQEALSTIAQKGEMLMLMGELIPLYRLHKIFNIEGAVQNPTDGLVMVMDDGDRRFAILVDELLGKLQVVAKTLGEGVGKVPGISGGAILGDGRVGLILDPQGLSNVLRNGDCLQPEAAGAGSS